MTWSHGWGLAGQILAIWIVLAIVASLLVGRLLRGPKATYSVLQKGVWVEVSRAELIAAIQKEEWEYLSRPKHSRPISVKPHIEPDETPFLLDEPEQPRASA